MRGQTQSFKLIELYQKEPCIWNAKHKNHKDKTKVNDAWLRIANEMAIPVAEIKKKKETLLSSFRLNHKKVVASIKSGAGEDEIFKPIWIFYDALATFLSDVYECKSILTSEDHIVQDENSVEKLPPISLTSSNVPQVSDESTGAGDNAAHTTSRVSIPVQRRRSQKPIELQETNTQVKNALSTLNNVLSENRKQPCEDDCDLYGKLLAKKLRQYSELDRQDLMYEIDGILIKKRRSLSSSSPPFPRSYVSSPSQFIMGSNVPSTSQNIISDRSVHIVNNRSLTAQSNYSVRVPSPADNVVQRRPSSTLSSYSSPSPTYGFTYHQPSPTDTSVSSRPQIFITNQPSSANVTLHIPDESEGPYHYDSQSSDILVQALEAFKD